MAATDHRDPLSSPWTEPRGLEPIDLSSLRVAISEDLGFAPVDDGIQQVFRRAMDQIRDVFAIAEDREPPLDGADEAFEVTRALAFLAAHGETFEANPDVLGSNIKANVEQGLGLSAADVARGMRHHTNIYRSFLEFMEGYDALICPAMSVPPFPHEQLHPTHINGQPLRTYFHWLALAYGLTLTAHPVVCIPCGRDHTGMPFGIQICGKRGGDQRVLSIAAQLERDLQGIEQLARPIPDLDALAA